MKKETLRAYFSLLILPLLFIACSKSAKDQSTVKETQPTVVTTNDSKVDDQMSTDEEVEKLEKNLKQLEENPTVEVKKEILAKKVAKLKNKSSNSKRKLKVTLPINHPAWAKRSATTSWPVAARMLE